MSDAITGIGLVAFGTIAVLYRRLCSCGRGYSPAGGEGRFWHIVVISRWVP
jgi:hypothetical protein